MAAGRNYQRKGDPFTLKVQRGEGPPCVQRWERQGTGRVYFTRVPVHRCSVVRVEMLAQAVREHTARAGELHPQPVNPEQLAGVLVFDWTPSAARVRVLPSSTALPRPGTVRLTLSTSRTGRGGVGVRFWVVCPRCSRPCGAVYASTWGAAGRLDAEQHVTGCRACLGLTDESQQRHKCLDWAGAVDGSRKYAPDRLGWYRPRSPYTVARAAYVFRASCARALPGFFEKSQR
ncbi:hypothetical protein K7W42_07575 [Deinococcus sp. HMF7604]|uniref:hypothetical protein n=1 Tax=Deinococcus betulae TaxID=2873312 RepID=UPI001CCBC1FD|nr:hypothetical protein [Deinococcus betulae]MBZ9750718.1 hypothetical protein [Deinococcus betulae]